MTMTIPIEELTIGMFVQDVIWSSNQYKVKSKGLVKSQRTIEQPKKQGVVQLIVNKELQVVDTAQNDVPHPKKEKKHLLTPECNKNTTSVEAELSQSFKIYDEAAENVKELFLNASRDEALSTETICVLASEITKSVVRNEYAMAILTRLRHHSTYQWEHSINCGVLMCGFALFLGLKEDVVTQLTLGAMLHDVGVAKVSRGILDKKTQFTANDISVMKKHISWGVEICKRDGFSTKIITEMTVNHHERLDGSGYPRGLKAEKISKLSRMIAIIDVYDAITGEKTYKDTMQPIDALRHLLGKKEHFDQELVQQFIKYVGVYPVGSLVKLSNDRLAIVMQGNRVNPVKPIVKVFFNITEMSYISAKTHNLQDYSVNIVAAVNAEEFDINLSHVIRKTIA